MKKCIVCVIIMMMMLAAGCSGAKPAPENQGILGTWYESAGGNIYVTVFYEDGTYYIVPEEFADDAEQDYLTYDFNEETGAFGAELYDIAGRAEISGTVMEYSFEEYGEKHVLYRDKEQAKANDPAYYMSDEFLEEIRDQDGLCIKDDILYGYRGESSTVTVPGTVKEIKAQAFAFTGADVIVIEEGVKVIGDDAFMDSYIKEIHFPASLTEIGERIMETEEGLRGTEIHVVGGSAADKYFEENRPYGDVEIIKR